MARKHLARSPRNPASRAKPPFALQGIDHILLLVEGMAAAVRFYTKVLGCTVEDRLPQFGMLQLRAGGALIDLVDIAVPEAAWAKPPVARGRNIDHICLALESHDEAKLRRHLARHRIETIEEGIHSGSRGESLSLYIRDPSGNVIELKGPPA